MPLPDPPAQLPDFSDVRKDVVKAMTTPNRDVLEMDDSGTYGPLFVRLAWQCASTFRGTDYQVPITTFVCKLSAVRTISRTTHSLLCRAAAMAHAFGSLRKRIG